MDAITFLPSPHAADETIGHDLAEIDAAIGLVVHGLATRVQLVGLKGPEAVAATALAHAQAARVRFSLDRGACGTVALTLGPRS
ncbi:MAG: hypothetical protein A2Z32_07330 [Chloroflexi bacterium RBG_16_69_14]|nr:MAG: hypothetical protein A2Z32_07330 [Chloroflexi bacterium RBG_16_69_14]